MVSRLKQVDPSMIPAVCAFVRKCEANKPTWAQGRFNEQWFAARLRHAECHMIDDDIVSVTVASINTKLPIKVFHYWTTEPNEAFIFALNAKHNPMILASEHDPDTFRKVLEGVFTHFIVEYHVAKGEFMPYNIYHMECMNRLVAEADTWIYRIAPLRNVA